MVGGGGEEVEGGWGGGCTWGRARTVVRFMRERVPNHLRKKRRTGRSAYTRRCGESERVFACGE